MRAISPEVRSIPPRPVRIDGKRSVSIRSIEASDAAGLSDFYARLSPESKRRRFLSYRNPANRALGRAFTEHEGEGFIGILDAPGPNDGVVVAHASLQPDGHGSAEIAFAVSDALQGHGIGSALMQTAVEHAHQLGLQRLSATMFADNTPMRRLLRGAGCEIASDQIDAGTEEIALAICSLAALSPRREFNEVDGLDADGSQETSMKHMIADLPVEGTHQRVSHLTPMLPPAAAETASEWVVCHQELRDAPNGMVACPLTSERVTVLEHCLACRHLSHLSNERTREASCAAGEPYS